MKTYTVRDIEGWGGEWQFSADNEAEAWGMIGEICRWHSLPLDNIIVEISP